MTSKKKADQDKTEKQAKAEEKAPEAAPNAGPETAPETAAAPAERTSNGYVEAKLKSRHCSGGLCKEAGETMRMTRGEYARLKKYDRVE
ncbi:hypothetical protein HLV39_12405 [Marinobacter adhaerens]|uniref:Uncharacterized protein n=1 Tax=Marinobacter adhaerens TaxID=1033846 RepID=A0A851HTE9_9GAMM|nr:hypothetical protein [Marinobacter adhaerens]NWN92293.1 hypothetical protein [Marinobacter adhaerens]